MTGTIRSTSVTRPRASQASSTASMSAMSAIEQPGVEVGQEHLLVVAGEDVGRLGHEMDAAEDDELGVAAVGGDPRQAEGVAPGIGPAHDLVALVVMAEDRTPAARAGLGRADPVGELVGRGGGVALGERTLEPEHVVYPLSGSTPMWPAGTAWSPIRGFVGLGAVCRRDTRPALPV